MSKNWAILVVTVIGVGAFLVAVAMMWPPREPIHNKKPLSYWINDIDSPDPDSQRAAQKAIEAIGGDAVPFLVRAINRQNSILHERYRMVWLKLPAVFERKFPRPESKFDVFNENFLGLTCVGPPALPALCRQLEDPDHSVRYYAIVTLMAIGDPSIPTLIGQLKARNWRTRQAAIRIIGLSGSNAHSAIAVLNSLLTDPNSEVRSEASLALEVLESFGLCEAMAGLLAKVAVDAFRSNLVSDFNGYTSQLTRLLGSEAPTPIRELHLIIRNPNVHGELLEGANAAVLSGILRQLTNSNPVIRNQAAVALTHGALSKTPSAAYTEFYQAAVEEINGTNPFARQEAAFAMWWHGGGVGMIDLLIKELQRASDLETGARILGHFAQMGEAIKPSILVISNIVIASPPLRSLSNEVWRLSPTLVPENPQSK